MGGTLSTNHYNYKPDLWWVLRSETEEQKALRHSEKLALCFGLLVFSESVPIFIINNLRMCGDCHYYGHHITSRRKEGCNTR